MKADMKRIGGRARTFAAIFCAVVTGLGWQGLAAQSAPPQTVVSNSALASGTTAMASGPADYVVAAEDLLRISVYDAPDMSTTVRVSTAGTIELPLLGRVHASGLTVAALSQNLADRLDQKYLQDAQVAILVEEFHGQPLVVTGAVHNPGVIELTQPIPLTDAIARSGGLTDAAGNTVVLSGPGMPDVNIPVHALINAPGTAAATMVHGGMTVSVPPAGMVFVLGAVNKAGGFPITNNQDLTVMQALALAQGLSSAAAKGRASLITTTPDGGHKIEPLDLTAIMRGQAPDPQLPPSAIVVVPDSTGKVILTRSLDASVSILVGGLTYGRF